jgi:hypothetical protein
MKRLLVIAALGLLLVPLPGSAQYPPNYGYNDPEQMVQGWYRQFLGRAADPYASSWIEQLKSGQAPEAVLGGILASSEYYLRAGGTPDGFIRRLHMDLTGRPPGASEVQFWLNRLYQSDRQDIAYKMLQRYPQGWGGAPAAPPEPDYRRPFLRYRP